MLCVVVEQLEDDNIDVIVKAVGPENLQIAEVSNNLDEAYQPERVPLVASIAGEYGR